MKIWNVNVQSRHWQAENLSCARLQAMKKTWFLAIKSQFLYKCEQSYIIKQIKKAKTVLSSVIKHSRKWREHSRRREKHSPAARVHPTLLSCSRHFLACFITEQSTVLVFLFVNYRDPVVSFDCVKTALFCVIIKFRYSARSDWLKQRALSEYRCTE